MREDIESVLLTGATGFVGSHVYSSLVRAGYTVVCGSRNPQAAQRRFPHRRFRALDVGDPALSEAAMQGCDAAIYLVHALGQGPGYERAEAQGAEVFAQAAQRAGLRRIVYLGGVRPAGEPSRHLRSRLRTGEILRAGAVPTIELRAAMVIGGGSQSWRIVRDLAARLPVMILPRWLESRSQPVYIDDVAAAIVHALRVPLRYSGAYSIPGPDILTAREIIEHTARLMGLQPWTAKAPLMSPRLSSYFISVFTRAERSVAQQLVEGLSSDLVVPDDGFWRLFCEHRRVGFHEAARRALAEETAGLPWQSQLTEWAIQFLVQATLKRRAPRATLQA